MKYLSKLWVKITIVIILSFLFAGGITDISYPLPEIQTEQGGSGGVTYEDVLSHPKDLLNNKQNSLVRFSQTFVVLSAVASTLVVIPVLVNRNKH